MLLLVLNVKLTSLRDFGGNWFKILKSSRVICRLKGFDEEKKTRAVLVCCPYSKWRAQSSKNDYFLYLVRSGCNVRVKQKRISWSEVEFVLSISLSKWCNVLRHFLILPFVSEVQRKGAEFFEGTLLFNSLQPVQNSHQIIIFELPLTIIMNRENLSIPELPKIFISKCWFFLTFILWVT